MIMMSILFRYFSFKILRGILSLWLFLGMVVSILNLIEILARLSDNENASFALALKIMLLKMPSNFQILLPFAMVMGTALALLAMRRNNEFIVMMMSGLKQRHLVLWVMIASLMISVVALLSDNFVAKSISQYRLYERNVLSLQNEEFNEYFFGLKFYHQTDAHHYYIHLHSFDKFNNTLGSSKVVVSDRDTGKLRDYITSSKGEVVEGKAWRLSNVKIYRAGEKVVALETYDIPIPISYQNLAFLASPLDTIGFFTLPKFIVLAQKVGAQTSLYQITYWQKLLSPVLYAIFAVLAFGIVRLVSPRQSTAWTILKCFLWALILNFGNNLIGALGSAEQISLFLSLGAQLFFPFGIMMIFLMKPGIT